MTTTKLIWHKANETPDHDCEVLVLCEWYGFFKQFAIFNKNVKKGQVVKFYDYLTVGWAEIDFEKIEKSLTNTFNPEWVEFLHNNIKNI